MALFSTPFAPLPAPQRPLAASRTGGGLDEAGPGGGGASPPINVFRKGDDFALIAEVPGVRKADLEVQVKGNTIRLAGTKAVAYPAQAGVHRRERLGGRFDRVVTLPFEIDAEAVQAQCRDGLLALLLPRAAQDKPRTIEVR